METLIEKPVIEIEYQGVNITEDIIKSVVGVSVVDKLGDESDTASVVIEDIDGRWRDSWYPEEGDAFSVKVSFDGGAFGPNRYEIDRAVWDMPPSTVTLSGVSTPITASLRQANSFAYENTTLEGIAATIAARHNLTVVGDIPDIRFKRITQKQEHDLSFLRSLAADYGLIFKIESLDKLVFFRVDALEAQEPAFTLSPGNPISQLQIEREAAGTYKSATIFYQSGTEEFKRVTVNADGETIDTADSLRIRERVDSLDSAKNRVAAALKLANRNRITARVSIPGSPGIVAGQVITLERIGRLSGNYLVTQVSHRIGSAFDTRLQVRRVG